MKKWLLSTVQCALCTHKNFSICAAKAAKINFYKPFCNIIVERERTSQKILTKIGTTGCTQAFLLPYNGLMIGFPGEQHYEATPLVDSVSAADTTGNATQEQHNSDPRAATSCSPILSRCFSFEAEWISKTGSRSFEYQLLKRQHWQCWLHVLYPGHDHPLVIPSLL